MRRIIILLLILVAGVNAQMHTPRNIQSPYDADDFWTQWGSVNPRMTLFVLVTPSPSWEGYGPIGFTSNTRNMTLPGHPGVTFYATPGMSPSVLEMTLGEPSLVEITGVYQSGLFTQQTVSAGVWNYADVEIFSACWDNTDLGELLWFKGNIAEFKDYQTFFTAEGKGLIARLSSENDVVTSRLCRVKEFGDAECGKDLSGTVTIGGVDYLIRQTAVTGVRSFSPEAVHFDTTTFAGNTPADATATALYAPYYANGVITALDGDNEGISREISAGQDFDLEIDLYLKRQFPYPLQPGVPTTFRITMGCVRTPENCKQYTNIDNFAGEPFVPGLEAVNKIE